MSRGVSLSFILLTCSTLVKPETGCTLNLISFKETARARRLVPNTDELNEIIDRFVDSISRFFKTKHVNSTTIPGLYQPFIDDENGKKLVHGVLRTSKAHLENPKKLKRGDNAYIYYNAEDNIQVVTKLELDPLEVSFDRYDFVIGKFYGTGDVNMTLNSPEMDLSLTITVNQNMSLPLVFFCSGTVDELTLTVANLNLSISGLNGGDIYDQAFASFSSYFETVVKPYFESMMALQFEVASRTDDYVCSSMVLCSACSFYASDF